MTKTALRTLLAPMAWGTTYITITELMPAGRPLLVAAMRVLPAGLVLAALALWRDRWRPRRGDWGQVATLGTLNFALFFPLLAVAVYRLPGGVAAAIGGIQPLAVLALSAATGAGRPRRLHLLAAVVAVVGVSLVVIRPGARVDAVGVLAGVFANMAFAGGVVLTKRFGPPASRIGSTGWQLLLAATVLVPLSLVVEGTPRGLDGQAVVGALYLSLVGTAAAFLLWFAGIRRLPAAAPPLLGLASPVVGAVLGWAVLGQALGPVQLAGFVLTLSAIAVGATVGATVGVTCHPSGPDRWRIGSADHDLPLGADRAAPGQGAEAGPLHRVRGRSDRPAARSGQGELAALLSGHVRDRPAQPGVADPLRDPQRA